MQDDFDLHVMAEIEGTVSRHIVNDIENTQNTLDSIKPLVYGKSNDVENMDLIERVRFLRELSGSVRFNDDSEDSEYIKK